MSLNFKKLFTVKVDHSYYRSGKSREDIIFIPSRECRALLQGHRMLFRNNMDGGISVLHRVMSDNTTPFIDLDENTYVFGLSLKNKARFLNITDLKDTENNKAYASGRIAYFRNEGNASTLAYELIDQLRPSVFTYEFKFSPAVPASSEGALEIQDADGNTVKQLEGITSNAAGIFSTSLDLSDLPKGKYTFVSSHDTNTTAQEETVYIDSDLAGKDVFGIMAITNPGTIQSTPFRMQFERLETYWRYFVVLKSGNIENTATISIEDSAIEGTGSAYTIYNFNDKVAPVALNGMTAVQLTSNEPIPFFEDPKLGFELTAGASVVLKDLPNPRSSGTISGFHPSDSAPISEVYVYV